MEITNIFINMGISVVGGAAGCSLFVWFGKKSIEQWLVKQMEKFKHVLNKELALKTAQYSVLVPKQKKIAEELYSKILKLQKSTKLAMDFISIIKQQIKESADDVADENREIKFKFTPVFINKETSTTNGRVFTYDEIMKISDYKQLQSEVNDYIEQTKISMPKDIINNINAVLLMIEMFYQLYFPKEFIQYMLQDQLGVDGSKKFANNFDDLKKDVSFDDNKVTDVVDGLFSEIQHQFRILLGVEDK